MSIYFSNLQNQRKINQWYPFYSSMQSDAAFANMFAAMFTLKLAKNRPWIKVVNRNVNANSCRKLRFFLCSTLVPCWSVHFSHFIPELSIYHINDYFDSADPSSMQDACHTSTQLMTLLSMSYHSSMDRAGNDHNFKITLSLNAITQADHS